MCKHTYAPCRPSRCQVDRSQLIHKFSLTCECFARRVGCEITFLTQRQAIKKLIPLQSDSCTLAHVKRAKQKKLYINIYIDLTTTDFIHEQTFYIFVVAICQNDA